MRGYTDSEAREYYAICGLVFGMVELNSTVSTNIVVPPNGLYLQPSKRVKLMFDGWYVRRWMVRCGKMGSKQEYRMTLDIRSENPA